MARRKRPVALFEVIHTDKRFAHKPPPPLQRPVAVAIKMPETRHAPAPSKPPAPTPATPRRASPISWQKFTERATVWWQRLRAAAAPRMDRLRKYLEPQYPVIAGAAAALLIIGAVAVVRHLTHPA